MTYISSFVFNDPEALHVWPKCQLYLTNQTKPNQTKSNRTLHCEAFSPTELIREKYRAGREKPKYSFSCCRWSVSSSPCLYVVGLFCMWLGSTISYCCCRGFLYVSGPLEKTALFQRWFWTRSKKVFSRPNQKQEMNISNHIVDHCFFFLSPSFCTFGFTLICSGLYDMDFL